MNQSSALPLPVVIIEPQEKRWKLGLKELWAYRDLVYFFAWRDIKVRYKQTALGALWAVLQPVFATIVFTIFFGRLAKLPSDGVPYPVFAYVGMVPWQFFSSTLAISSNSLVGSQNLIKKVYFPRLIIPLAAVIAGLVDFAISFVVLIAMMFYYGVTPTGAMLLLPPLILLVIATTISVGLWFSALNVQFRDVRYTVPFLTQFWMFATPVVYSSSLVPAKWRTWYGLNPMAGVVDGFRCALLGKASPGPMLWVSVAAVLLLLIGGLLYFRRMEATFADVV
jgi:lipopolysaccharide transport system permease protein